MFGLWGKSRSQSAEDQEAIEVARSSLHTLRSKAIDDGQTACVLYGEGVGEVAGMLAQRFNTDILSVLNGKICPPSDINQVLLDLHASIKIAQRNLVSPSKTMQSHSVKVYFGSTVFVLLLQMAFLSNRPPSPASKEAELLFKRYVGFARFMSEIGAGVRAPNELAGRDF